jgi:hypothetical protein
MIDAGAYVLVLGTSSLYAEGTSLQERHTRLRGLIDEQPPS